MSEYALGMPAAYAPANARAAFIRRTYAHLAGAILAFISVEYVLFNLVPAETLNDLMLLYLRTPYSHFILLAAFIGTGYLARYWAHGGASQTTQYLGLGLYVVAEAAIFLPILWLALRYLNAPDVVAQAGILTLGLFGGLTAAVLITRKDFSFLGPILGMAFFVALGLIVAAMIFGFSLGLWFALGMVVLAAASILYSTSNVLHHYHTEQHVAAALDLFASVALLFYYILMILLSRRS